MVRNDRSVVADCTHRVTGKTERLTDYGWRQMQSLEEKYAGAKDYIGYSRQRGAPDSQIEQWLQEDIQGALKRGWTQKEIDERLRKSPK